MSGANDARANAPLRWVAYERARPAVPRFAHRPRHRLVSRGELPRPVRQGLVPTRLRGAPRAPQDAQVAHRLLGRSPARGHGPEAGRGRDGARGGANAHRAPQRPDRERVGAPAPRLNGRRTVRVDADGARTRRALVREPVGAVVGLLRPVHAAAGDRAEGVHAHLRSAGAVRAAGHAARGTGDANGRRSGRTEAGDARRPGRHRRGRRAARQVTSSSAGPGRSPRR